MTRKKYGRYQIESELGRGGMANVYLAHDPRFGRKVALKVMSRALQDDPTFRGRFEREARIIATLEHPAIVPVYDYGEVDGQPFLVMRYMPGGTLAERIIAQPFSLATAVPIIQRLAGALDHAHQQGIIHRDLKPGNILFDQYENAFLTDFGIVKLAAGSSTDLTGSGVIGTPAYMSPEQIHGEQSLDGRSDIYTLGIILFEMLTGRKPYRADTPVKQMMAHVLNPIPYIREIKPELPDAFEQVMQRVLAKERNLRFATAEELTQAISQTLSGLSPPPVTESSPPDSKSTAELEDAPTISMEPPASVAQAMPTIVAERVVDLPPAEEALAPKRPFRWLGFGLLGVLLVAAVLWGANRLGQADPTPTAERVELVLPTQIVPEPSVTAVPAATVTVAPISSPTQVETLPTSVITTIGQSANGTPLEVVRLGSGPTTLVFVAGLHAGFAPGSVELAKQVIDYYTENLTEIPPEITLLILPNVNPDSPRAPGQLAGRLNGNGVDLNRNWDCRWVANPPWGSEEAVDGLGGSAPFSEPEVRSLSNFIVAQESTAVIFWQAKSAGGLVSPGECADGSTISQTLANVYGGATDYRIADFEALLNTEVPGDATNWLDSQGIPAISVLNRDYTATDFEENLAAIDAVMQFYANGGVAE
ncbi:protein kinase domain-containing protein [Candidatus Leptofilum sp.]|uniref:protein kinase domain-containing protein n=1 Tax=Candidatus Leptofilum sp. TaxID=3241576 RepID=UPI003B5AC8F9